MNKRDEALVLMMEECGELTQACSKVIRTDGDKKYMKNLQDEIGDVMCMVEILHMAGLVEEEHLLKRIKNKKRKLKRWSKIFDEAEV